MGTERTDEFRKDAVGIALTSELTQRQVADDLGVGLSTLNKWVIALRDTNVVSHQGSRACAPCCATHAVLGRYASSIGPEYETFDVPALSYLLASTPLHPLVRNG